MINKTNIHLLFIFLFGSHQVLAQTSANYMNNSLLRAGNLAPNFALQTVDNGPFLLSENKGKIIVLDFWYIGCKPCIKANNDLQQVLEQIGSDNIIVVGLNAVNSKGQINRYVRKQEGYDLQLLCSENVRNQYGVKAYPTLYVIDQNGNIALGTAGYYENLKIELKEVLSRLTK
jgi:thiol-disulfide isomerase/thioredoxin